MKFLVGKWVQSLFKKVVAAGVAFATGPILAPWLQQFGVTIDPVILSTGMFTSIEGFRTWITHQAWWEKAPAWLKLAL